MKFNRFPTIVRRTRNSFYLFVSLSRTRNDRRFSQGTTDVRDRRNKREREREREREKERVTTLFRRRSPWRKANKRGRFVISFRVPRHRALENRVIPSSVNGSRNIVFHVDVSTSGWRGCRQWISPAREKRTERTSARVIHRCEKAGLMTRELSASSRAKEAGEERREAVCDTRG